MMVDHPLHPNGKFHIDDNLYENIMPLTDRTSRLNKDNLFLICGDPGNGKSTITSQILWLLDKTIIESKNVFTDVNHYRNYCMSLLKKGMSRNKSAIHDEARDTGGVHVIEKKIRDFWTFIYENRFLNMNHALVQADFFKVPRDIIYFRSRFLLWVVEDDRWNNGIYFFFGRRDMRRMYERGKKRHELAPQGYSFKGRFVNFWAGNPTYLEMKKTNFMEKWKDRGEKRRLYINEIVPWVLKRNMHAPVKDVEIIKVLNISMSQFYNIKKDFESEYYKSGEATKDLEMDSPILQDD